MSDETDPAKVFGHEPASNMSLRDYFAGQAFASVVSIAMDARVERKSEVQTLEADIAAQAYAFADAMLAERERAK